MLEHVESLRCGRYMPGGVEFEVLCGTEASRADDLYITLSCPMHHGYTAVLQVLNNTI